MESVSRMRSQVRSAVPAPSLMPTSAKPPEISSPVVLAKNVGAPRILAADDQQHILEAIELLLKPQGYKIDVVRSPELARELLANATYDAALIDLNYTRDTTSGRAGPAIGDRGPRQRPSRDRDDCMGQRRACG